MNLSVKELIATIFSDREEYKNNDDERRLKRVEVKMTPKEFELLKSMSKGFGDRSTFIRYVIFKKYIDDFIQEN